MGKTAVEELLERSRKDQKMRISAKEGKAEWDSEIDKDNTEYLRKLVEQEGWPSISLVGEEASQAAWLIAQHADHDPEFQSRCLEFMKALPDNEVNPANLAYLEDRVRVSKGYPQLYGTQFYEGGDFFGPRPIEDIDELDNRRRAVGLKPFKNYEARMRELQRGNK